MSLPVMQDRADSWKVKPRQVITVIETFTDKHNNEHELRVVLSYGEAFGYNDTLNRFTIQPTLYTNGKNINAYNSELYPVIEQHMPLLYPFCKWQNCSQHGPQYYFINTLYWLGMGQYGYERLDKARAAAIWEDMPEDLLKSKGGTEETAKHELAIRLPDIITEFRVAMESLGFDYWKH